MVTSRATTVLLGLLLVSVSVGCSDGPPDEDDGGVDGGDADTVAGDSRAGDSRPADGSADGDDDGGSALAGPITIVGTEIGVSDERLCDMNDDGLLDNAIADLGTPMSGVFASTLSTMLGASLLDVDNRIILHFPWVEDRSIPYDLDVNALLFKGLDTDSPFDPSDDLSGEEPFYARADYLDRCGEPVSVLRHVRIEDGEVEALHDETSSFVLGRPNQEVVLRGVRAYGRLEPWGTSGEMKLCTYLLIGELGTTFVLDESRELSLLEVFLTGGRVFGLATVPGLTPDVDLDGDGLERFDVDESGNVVSCVDGDLTVIPGADCWADPRMADAFGFVMTIAGVSARFAGRPPGWQSSCDDPPETSLFDPV